MNKVSKYAVLPASGVGIALQAKEMVLWISQMIEAGSFITMPDGPATLISIVAIVWPLGMLFPASDRTPPEPRR